MLIVRLWGLSLSNPIDQMYPMHSVGKGVMKQPGICAVEQICVLGVDQLSTACPGLIIGGAGGLILDVYLVLALPLLL